MGRCKRDFKLKAPEDEKLKVVCRECCRETIHIIAASYMESGSEDVGGGHSVDWTCENQVIQCLGCESVSFRVVSTCSEDYHVDEDGMEYIETIKYYPGRAERLKGINTCLLPAMVQPIYEETVLAIENEQNVLAGIGVRALIETICKDQEAEGKDLYHKINSLKDKSILTSEGAETLHKLRILGNSAAHEVKAHNKEQLFLALQIIDHMLDGTYIIPHQVAKVFK